MASVVAAAAAEEAVAAVVVEEPLLSAVKPGVLAVQHRPEQTYSEQHR